MTHDDNIAVLAEGIWVRGRRDRATTNRAFVMLRADGERANRPTTEERTQPMRVVHLLEEP